MQLNIELRGGSFRAETTRRTRYPWLPNLIFGVTWITDGSGLRENTRQRRSSSRVSPHLVEHQTAGFLQLWRTRSTSSSSTTPLEPDFGTAIPGVDARWTWFTVVPGTGLRIVIAVSAVPVDSVRESQSLPVPDDHLARCDFVYRDLVYYIRKLGAGSTVLLFANPWVVTAFVRRFVPRESGR